MAVAPAQCMSTEYLYQGYSDSLPVEPDVEATSPDPKAERTFLQNVHPKFRKLGTCLATLKLELVVFVFMVSYIMTKVTSTVMVLEKVCLVHFHYPPDVCSGLDNFTNKSSVERVAANYNLAISLIRMGPAAVLAIFLGPWSDHYGRKLPALLAISGMVLDSLGSSVCARLLETRVEYYFIPALFAGLLGGSISFLAVMYSFVTDLTLPANRIMKYAFVELSSGLAVPVGGLLGGWVYELLGYPTVFLMSAGGFVLSLVFVMFLVEETRGLDTHDPWSVKLSELFSCRSFSTSFKATVKKRPHQGRKQIVLLVVSICFLAGALTSSSDINYLFAHHQFGWGNARYSTITAVYSAVGMALLVVVIPLLKRFQVGDPGVGLIGTIVLLWKNVGTAFSSKPGLYHAANLFGLVGGCSTFAVRSRISKVVSKDDLGKVFSFVATSESLLPILTTLIMTQTFNAFIDTFPGMPYMIVALLLIFPLGVFSWMSCLPKMSSEDINFANDDPKNEDALQEKEAYRNES